MIIDKELLLKKKKELQENLTYVREEALRYEAQIDLIDGLIESTDDILSEVIINGD